MSSSAADLLTMAPGLQLHAFDSSASEPTYRAELSDGRHFQINEKLYLLLSCLTKPQSVSALGRDFEQLSGQSVERTELLEISDYLLEHGLVRSGATAEDVQGPVANQAPPAKKNSLPNDSFLSLHYRWDLVSPHLIAPFARVLSALFNRSIAIIATVVIVAAHILAYAHLGLPPNMMMEGISWPTLYIVLSLGVLIHELGHLAACHRWHCDHGPLGVGLYFLNPVFYVDVTNAWRLPRWQRVVVDMGGVYLELLLVPIFWLLFVMTHDSTWLMAIIITDITILTNFEPFMKLDGYWLLSDLTGVPNLHKRTGEMMKQSWQWALARIGLRRDPVVKTAFANWSPRVRRIIIGYVILSVAMWPAILAAMFPLMIQAIRVYPALWQEAFGILLQGIQQGNWSVIGSQLQALFLPTLAILNMGFMVKIVINRRRNASGSQSG